MNFQKHYRNYVSPSSYNLNIKLKTLTTLHNNGHYNLIETNSQPEFLPSEQCHRRWQQAYQARRKEE